MSPKRDEVLSVGSGCDCFPQVGEGQRPPAPMPVVETKPMKFKLPKKGEEVYLSEETVAFLKTRVNGCFLCRFILEDQEKHGKLTGYPNDLENKGLFPVEGKVMHIQLEKR